MDDLQGHGLPEVKRKSQENWDSLGTIRQPDPTGSPGAGKAPEGCRLPLKQTKDSASETEVGVSWCYPTPIAANGQVHQAGKGDLGEAAPVTAT